MDKYSLNTINNYDKLVNDMLEQAVNTAKLNDFGDLILKEPLLRLLNSYENDKKLNHVELKNVKISCVEHLITRLKIQNDLKKFKEINDITIVRPLFLTGTGRSGTTLLHRLLSLNSSMRALKYWELMNPSPPANYDEKEDLLKRKISEKYLKLYYLSMPEFKRIHMTEVESPEECKLLLSHTFMFESFIINLYCPSYFKWLNMQDISFIYAYYKKILRLFLINSKNKYLLLKDPFHFKYIKTIFNIFHDANLVVIHRSYNKVIPSFCSLAAVRHKRPEVDFLNDGINNFIIQLEEYIEYKDIINKKQILNIDFLTFKTDPVKTIYGILEYFNYEIDSDLDKKIINYLNNNKPEKFGKHDYNIEEFGLDKDEIEKKFKKYHEIFKISEE